MCSTGTQSLFPVMPRPSCSARSTCVSTSYRAHYGSEERLMERLRSPETDSSSASQSQVAHRYLSCQSHLRAVTTPNLCLRCKARPWPFQIHRLQAVRQTRTAALFRRMTWLKLILRPAISKTLAAAASAGLWRPTAAASPSRTLGSTIAPRAAAAGQSGHRGSLGRAAPSG